MFGIEDLKERIEITDETVECPVRGCAKVVDRQRKRFKTSNEFMCQEHGIHISPSTFEYSSELDNMLWKERDDLELFEKIKEVKRESRIARDNSEDAVSWNVFRFLERNNLVDGFLSSLIGSNINLSDVIYWSYSQAEGSSSSVLNKARREFGETIARGSEPDIIIKTNKALFFIEAKVTAGNKTIPSKLNYSKKYETGGENWFSEVFKSDYKTVAILEKKYELMRFWLLGTWIAKQLGLDFYLINLVLSERDADIESIFKKHINESKQRKFIRVTWERIYQYIVNCNSLEDKEIMMTYFKNKTIGYNGNGRLQRAFLKLL